MFIVLRKLITGAVKRSGNDLSQHSILTPLLLTAPKVLSFLPL